MAEDHFLQASRPELVLDMYRDHGMFNEALKIAQSHLPHMLPEINAALKAGQFKSGNSGGSGSGSGTSKLSTGNTLVTTNKSDILQLGKTYESKKQWGDAMDIYLTNPDYDISLYERAIELARVHMPNRAVEIAVDVAKRLVGMRKEEQAASILFEVGRFDEAIQVSV